MSASLDRDPALLSCPDCRGLGYVVDLIGEVRPCRREECVRKRAVEILEEGHGSGGSGPIADAFPGLSNLLKGNPEFKKLAGSFIVGGIAGVVAKMGSDLLAEAAKTSLPRPARPHCAGPRCWVQGESCRCECDGCASTKSPFNALLPYAPRLPAGVKRKKPSRRRSHE